MRAKGMQVLTDQIKAKLPGITIYGVGDDAHKTRVSGHNEDDTAGVRAEDQDPDSIPEHRALDVMVRNQIEGDRLVADLTLNEDNQERLLYVNWGNLQWSRSNDWEAHDNSKDPHGHVHVSGEADADDNESPWTLSDWTTGSSQSGDLVVDGKLGPHTIRKWQEVMGTKVDGEISPTKSQLVRAVQERLRATVNSRLVVDGEGIYQNGKFYKTAAALQDYLGVPVDGRISSPVSVTIKALQRRLNENRF